MSGPNPDQITVSFWFKSIDASVSPLKRMLFGYTYNGFNGVKLRLDSVASGGHKLRSYFSKSSSNSSLVEVSYDFDFQGDQWYHVAMTLDKVAGTSKTYINGVKVSELTGVESTARWTQTSSSKPFVLGSWRTTNDNNASSQEFDFDSFQITEGFALTDSQIASIYNDGSNREVVITSDM